MSVSRKRNLERVNQRNEIIQDIHDAKWKSKLTQVEKAIKEADESGDYDKLDEILEEL